MSAFQGGTQSGYEGISSYRLYLDLSLDDTEFQSGLQNPLFRDCIREYDTKSSHPPAYGGWEDGSDIYNWISENPQTSLFKRFIDFYNLKSFINSHQNSTVFVPIDKKMSTIFSVIQNTVTTPEDIIKFHCLDYILEPVQLYGRNLRLQPRLSGQTILTKDTSIITETSDKNPNKILESKKTSLGYIYLIEHPLIPYLY
jgi:hypothetical protein